jgi:uncharacterized protein YmfQ (DUF2313 family)
MYWGDTWAGLWGDYEPRAARWIGQLLPPGMALDQCTDEMRDLLAGTAEEWDIVYFEASEILRMLDPREEGYLQSDWERVTNSTEPYNVLLDAGSQAPSAYINIAEGLGYTDVTFSHVELWSCESSCEAPLYEEAWNLIIRVDGTSDGAGDVQLRESIRDRRQLGTDFIFFLV